MGRRRAVPVLIRHGSDRNSRMRLPKHYIDIKRFFVFGVGLAAVLSVAVTLASSQSRADGDNPQIGELLKAFEIIAFGSESKVLSARSKLLRWDTTQIGVNMTQFLSEGDHDLKPVAAKDFWVKFAWRHLRDLQGLTGLTFVDSIATKTRPRLTIVFTPRNLLAKVPIPGVQPKLQQELAAPGGCYFLSFAGGRMGALDRAFVVVNTDRDGRLIDHCLLEELTQSLGLPNDSDILRPSIFSDHDTLRKLSAGDEILVRTLYHKRMFPGMSRKAAMTMARLLIAQQLAARR
ncbi:MAG TPA: hypothetical protein DCG48_05960 [Rhodospirillaceae bacterium]|nr:hypothetical protein [Rhodospirillaceae bacterium]